MKKAIVALFSVLALAACKNDKKVTLITVDPGHFHAALLQNVSYDEINPDVYVYAPEGADLKAHLARIEGFNNRAENPTHWNEIVYTGDDFLEKMLAEKKGNLMITAGNNGKKPAYILKTVQAGINVLSDKPMAITPEDFDTLKESFETAEKNGVLLSDIMTERFEITTALQRELRQIPAIYGEQLAGTPEEPAVVKESVQHFFKNVSGNKLVRPAWYYDVKQQGEGIVDVTVHLVDIVQWSVYPDVVLDYTKDVEMISAKHWPTIITPAQFEASTGCAEFPEFLQDCVKDGNLECMANGEMTYKLKDTYAKVIVVWNYEAPAGTGDTHFSIMRGSKASLVIRQGAEQGYKPELYIEPVAADAAYESQVAEAFAALEKNYPGIALEKTEAGWHVAIPDSYKVGHEAHFSQVVRRYLKCLQDGKLPEWEVPNMLAKYYTTTQALKKAQE
jgi:predicted dehydrogenase